MQGIQYPPINCIPYQEYKKNTKSACHIILGDKYESYKLALRALDLEPLQSRRDKLSLNFALKSEKSDKFQKWFKPATYPQDTRQDKLKYCKVNAKHSRFMKSPISFLTNLLNEHYNKREWTHCRILENTVEYSCKVNYSGWDKDYHSLYLYYPDVFILCHSSLGK